MFSFRIRPSSGRPMMGIASSAAAIAFVIVGVLGGRAACARPAHPVSSANPADALHLNAIAFFYGNDVPVRQLEKFDVVVVEPDSGFDPRAQAGRCPAWFAYVSVGEVTHERDYARRMPKQWLFGRNTTWASAVVDQSAPRWPSFFVEQVIAPLWARGYRGFFLDTLDSYQLVAKTEAARAKQEAGLVAVIRAVKSRYPNAQLILNRGFEILPQVHDAIAAVAFESLFGNWDQRNRRYGAVPAADRDWLLARAKEIGERYALPVISIDYCAPDDAACRNTIAAKIRATGLIPYVTDGALRTVGTGPDATASWRCRDARLGGD
ncbi:endo alpha-1,4 polygalactosaminidase [Burkholderia cenocepacia]|uniref:endo alpha-1,4 polygalactosaminidase n=1 Tax=Burkholderia cenocepacia TaxID=95486 RepID=UPI0021AB618E|nr:endo alpha-1,4 polygalactosaminidase [Burkholderia cenocepacia]